MRDAFLIIDSIFELSDFKLYTKDLLKFEEISEWEIVHEDLNKDRSYFSISKDNSIFDLMEPFEKEKVTSEFSMFTIFACSFFELDYLRILVSSIPPNTKFLIDNDHGRIMERGEFLKLNSYEEFVKRG